MNPPGIKNKGSQLIRGLGIGLLACGGMAAAAHAMTCTVTTGTTIDPIGGDSITYQSPNWTTGAFKNYCAEDFQMVHSATMQAAAGRIILNFETANGFPSATSALTPMGTIFDSSNTISPYTGAGALTKITTTTGVSIDVQYRAFDNARNILSAPDTTQGNFIVLDRSVNDTMISGVQGLVAGSVYYQSFGPGGTYLNFDRNLQKFGVALNANSLSSTDIICLFDAEGVLLAKYSVGVAAGQALYFGVNSPSGIIRSVWIGQSTSTNGLVIDDVSFVPAAPPTFTNPFPFAGSSGTNGWLSNHATVTTSSDHVTIQSTAGDAKIYRAITLASGTWTMSGVGSGNTLVQLQTSWSTPPFAILNLSQPSGWCSDHMTFVTPSTTGSATYYLSVMVSPNPGTANIQTLSIDSARLTPYNIKKADLLTQKTQLTKVRGMNSNWSDSGTLGLTHFTEMRNWKANVVRLQMHPAHFANTKSQDFWTAWPAYRAAMVQNIRDAQTAGLKTVIDLHEPPFTEAPPVNTNDWSRPDLNMRYGMLWKDIAQTIVNNNLTSAVWAYEIINEPIDSRQMPSPPRQWWPLVANVINTIRTVDPSTWIIYDVGPGSLVDGFKNLRPLPDPSNRVIYSGHFYYPSNFCLQGINDSNHSTPYVPSSANLSGILDPVRAFEDSWNVPIYIGEFSTTRWGPVPDTANWMQDVVNLFEGRGWSWTYFCWKEHPAWRLDMDAGYPTGALLDDAHKSDRGTVIYNALQANP